MSFSYLNIELYYSAIENFHTFVYIYCMVRVTAKATDFNYFFLKSTLKSDQFDVLRLYKTIKASQGKYYHNVTHKFLALFFR